MNRKSAVRSLELLLVALALLVQGLAVPAQAEALSVTPGALPVTVLPSSVQPATVHPRLLFAAADVAGMRARVAAGGVPSQAWARLKEKADGHLVRVSPDLVRANVYLPVKDLLGIDGQGLERPYGLQGEMPSYLIELGLAYQVSGDAKYGRHAIELLKALGDAGWPFWTGGDDLGIGDLGLGVGLAFDWTYELMTVGERTQIVRSITANQEIFFVRSMFEYTNEASEYPTSNWSGVIGGGVGTLLLAIKGEPEAPTSFDSPSGPVNKNTGQPWPPKHYTYQNYFDKAVVKATRYLTQGFDALGAGHEGHTYANYGLTRSIPFALALRREGIADLLSNSGVQNAARWRAFEQLPGEGQNFASINDSARTAGTVDFEALMFAVNPNNGIAQWNWRRTVGELGEDYYGEPHFPAPVADEACPLDRWATAPLVSAACPALLHTAHVWAILFYRSPQETPEVDPGTTGPLSVHYNAMGLVDARTGFAGETNEILSTFQARRNGATGHAQYDGGQFTLYGEGARWAIDPGSACVSCGNPDFPEGNATFHNVIVIDGQLHTQSLYSRYFRGTTIDNFVNGPNLSLAHADMRYAYSGNPDTSFDPPFAGRDHFFSRIPGRPVVLGIADELERDGIPNPHAYQWQMITDRTNLVTTDGSSFTIAALSGATMTGASARDVEPTLASDGSADPVFGINPIIFNNNTDDSGPHWKISTVTQRQQKLEQVTLMAISPAGVAPAVMEVLRLGGANAIAVDWEGTRQVFLRRVRGAAVVSGEVQTDGRVASFVTDAGETILRAGTTLSAYGKNYVSVAGSASTVTVSGQQIAALGAVGNAYRVLAPQSVSSVTINGASAPWCREGDDVLFPCLAPTSLDLTLPASVAATDDATLTARLASTDGPISGRRVDFLVGTRSLTSSTDTNGVASVVVPMDVDAGSVAVHASFPGDEKFAPSAATGELLVTHKPTSIVSTGPTRMYGEDVVVSGMLLNADGDGLAGESVRLAVGQIAIVVTTEGDGAFGGVVRVPSHGREQEVAIVFEGTQRFEGHRTTLTVHWGA